MSGEIHVSELSPTASLEYDAFLLTNEDALLYASSPYRTLLVAITGATPRYLIARDAGGAIVGVLPAMVSKRGALGRVLNSLPYYGSNGGVITTRPDAARALIDAFHACAEADNCVAATIVTSPFTAERALYEDDARFTIRDERIGQLTPLPAHGPDVEQQLLGSFSDPRPRNIRRAMKEGIDVSLAHGDDALRFLHETHVENMQAIGGLAKSWEFFAEIAGHFETSGYGVWIARLHGEPIAALLCFYFNGTVEYFTPATVEAHRSAQPLSLLVFRAMVDAVARGCRWWNWGGTWLTQAGVYDYKRRWGTVERHYSYYTRVLDRSILQATREELLREFPFFFVAPFSRLLPRAPNPVEVS